VRWFSEAFSFFADYSRYRDFEGLWPDKQSGGHDVSFDYSTSVFKKGWQTCNLSMEDQLLLKGVPPLTEHALFNHHNIFK